jgi:hypothetical protein
LTEGIGLLRAIRLQRQVFLRDVEEQSLRLAQEWGNDAYRISACWLERLEREGHETPLSTIVVWLTYTISQQSNGYAPFLQVVPTP